MATYQLEEARVEYGLLERILAYEEQAIRVLNGQIQSVPVFKTLPGITIHTRLAQSKSALTGPDIPINLTGQKKVPRYYSSSFELTLLRSGAALAEPCPDGTMSLFSAFTPVVCTNRDEVLWYDYEKDFAQALTDLTDRIARAFPDGPA